MIQMKETPPPALLRRTLNRFQMRNAFTALRYPNYRLWFWGQMISLFGTWMQMTAQGFLVYELTRSPAYLGIVGFASGLPAWLFMLFAGVVADRVPRRGLMMVTQSAMMILAFVLSGLTFLHLVQPWHIIILTFLLGTANAFDAPARLAFVSELVDREDMTNAIAMNGTIFNAGAAVGPAAAGITYALAGPAWCFALNGLSFIAVIVALFLMKLKPFVPKASGGSRLAELKEGDLYALSQPVIRAILILAASIQSFAVSLVTLFPAWSVRMLHGDAATNGMLQSARGIGALAGALGIAALGRFRYKGKLLTFGTFAFPLFMFLFAFVRWLPLSLVLLVGIGGAFILVLNLANATVQSTVPDALRGRVMSVYSLVFFGFMPLGALMMGTIAEHTGEPTAIVTGAAVSTMVAVGLWRFVPALRASE